MGLTRITSRTQLLRTTEHFFCLVFRLRIGRRDCVEGLFATPLHSPLWSHPGNSPGRRCLGAFHFIWDFNSYMTARDVAMQLIARLAGTVSLSYVLGWLTIRSDSILPAAVAHAIYNIFILGQSLPVHNPRWLSILLWAVAGFVLFYFFPTPSPDDLAESDIPSPSEPQRSEVQ